jgi:hypothetical protein
MCALVGFYLPEPDSYVLGLPDPDPLVRRRYGSGSVSFYLQANSKKNLDSYGFVTSL